METTTTGAEGIEAELTGLEMEYWQALLGNNVATALRLTGFPCVVSGPQGIIASDRQSFEAMMGKPVYKLHAFELRDTTVTLPGRDIAIVAYRVWQDLTVDGERRSVECADSTTWVRQAGQWRAVQHSEAIIGDPFGRDREAAPAVH